MLRDRSSRVYMRMRAARACVEVGGQKRKAALIDADERYKIYEGNARRVYPRLDAALKTKGQ